MFDSISSFFKDRLATTGDEIDDARRLQVATCVLLLEVAHADDEFSPQEREKIGALVARRFQLDEQESGELMAQAEQARHTGDYLFQFSRLVNENFNRARKLAILELLWEVVFSDGVLESHEDVLMHKMGNLLGVRLEELMALKVQVKNRLK